MHYPKHIAAALSLLWLCMFSSVALASESDASKNSTSENYYLLKNTSGAFTLSSCAESELSYKLEARSDSCFAETFIPEDIQLSVQNFTETYSSTAILPVTGAALLGGSWSKHLHWLPKTALTKWALSLAGGAVVVGYLAEKFAVSKDALLLSSSASNNEHESLATSGKEEQLSSTSPDPKPLPPPVVSKDTDGQRETHATLTESDTTPLWESMNDEAFEALLNERNITAEDYQLIKRAVSSYAEKRLHVPGMRHGDNKRHNFYERPQREGSDLSEHQLMEAYEKRYIFNSSYVLLADVLKLIKNGTLRQFQGLSLVKDGYALYTRPLLDEVVVQMPEILNEIYDSSLDFKKIGLSHYLETYNLTLLEDPSPSGDISMVEGEKFLRNIYAFKFLTIDEGHSIPKPLKVKAHLSDEITSRIEKLETNYITYVKDQLESISVYHNMMWDFFMLPYDDQLSRVSLTRILESLVTEPSQYLKDHPQYVLFNPSIYTDPLFQEKGQIILDLYNRYF
ncbi:MAG: hypothetical protein OXC44_03485 [Proteobacteria bacterium]|nr:hypothetical protein [Pseudomonadota bacterium]